MMGFFMATTPRKTQTPGAKKETTTTVQTSTDDTMDAVLGKVEESKTTELTGDDATTEETQDSQNPTVEAPEGFISLEQFDAIAAQLANKEEELKGVTADLVASRKQVVKLTGGQILG